MSKHYTDGTEHIDTHFEAYRFCQQQMLKSHAKCRKAVAEGRMDDAKRHGETEAYYTRKMSEIWHGQKMYKYATMRVSVNKNGETTTEVTKA